MDWVSGGKSWSCNSRCWVVMNLLIHKSKQNHDGYSKKSLRHHACKMIAQWKGPPPGRKDSRTRSRLPDPSCRRTFEHIFRQNSPETVRPMIFAVYGTQSKDVARAFPCGCRAFSRPRVQEMLLDHSDRSYNRTKGEVNKSPLCGGRYNHQNFWRLT